MAQIQIDIQSEKIRVERQITNIEQEHQQKLKQEQETIDKERETQTYIISKGGYATLSRVGWTDFKQTNVEGHEMQCIRLNPQDRERAFKILEQNGQFCTVLSDQLNKAAFSRLVSSASIIKGSSSPTSASGHVK